MPLFKYEYVYKSNPKEKVRGFVEAESIEAFKRHFYKDNAALNAIPGMGVEITGMRRVYPWEVGAAEVEAGLQKGKCFMCGKKIK